MIRIEPGGTRASFVAALRDDAAAREALTHAIRSAPSDAVFWETPPLVASTADRPAEYVLVDAPTLASVRPNPRPFAAAFATSGAIATFPNLGGDAILVAPKPVDGVDCRHLAAFVRTAPDALVHALWIAVGDAVAAWRSRRADALWVSTSGLGVHWLHVRLDESPKYYSHRPYCSR